MSFAFSAKKVKGIKALSKDVLVINMDMGEQKTAGGLIIQSDDGKAHGVKPRWAKVYKVGSEIDLEKLALKHETEPAVGNARMNARGDELGAGGKIVKTREQILQDYYNNNPRAIKDEIIDRKKAK